MNSTNFERSEKLWKDKLNFPYVSYQVIQTKLDKVLTTYDECVGGNMML